MLSSEDNIVERVKCMTGDMSVDAVVDGVGAATLLISVGVLKDGGI
jgi:NADPH:quinone reductase-like Zn-dependent oxidoreductase